MEMRADSLYGMLVLERPNLIKSAEFTLLYFESFKMRRGLMIKIYKNCV